MAAEAVVSTIVSKAVETLGSAVFKEFALITGIKKEAERLESLVSRINSVILDAENQYYFNTGNNEQMKDWIKKLKDVMEDIENLLDDINTEALWQKAMGGNNFVKKVRLFFSSSNQFVYGVKMGREIKAVREKLDDISEERSKFNLEISPLTAVQPVLTQRAHETDAHCPHIVIGREEDKEKILEFLLSVNHEEDNVSVISIWGIGGLGKTTLAQHVYNDKNVEREFDGLRFWVCVSENFDVKTIMKNILGMNEETQLDSLTDKLQQKIGGKKYLLVLDDIWNEDINKWHDLKDRLMCGARGSKIIVTTRNSGIANMMSSTRTHELKGLSNVDKWGDPSTCKMHDLMHDLAKSVSGEGQHLYVSYNDNVQDIVLFSTSLEWNKVRTVLLQSKYSFRYKESWVEFIGNSRHLRALEMRSEYGTSDFDISDLVHILKLRHLRYLILANWSIKTLPNSIARLQNLQILNLNGCNGVQKLPKGITKLVNLMELYLEGCDSLTHMPCGIGKLPVLQVLSKLVVSHQRGSAKLIELDSLNKLKGNLEIKGLEEVKDPESECRVANLKAKQYLKHLELKWLEDWRSEDNEIRIQKEKRCLEELQPHVNLKSLSITGYGGITFPDWISTLTNLVKLRIQDCTKCQSIQPLDQLSSLKMLCIVNMPELEWIEVSCDSNYIGGEASFFPCLEDIEFCKCPKLVGWRRRSTTSNQDYIFSRLLSLRMYDCENLRDWIASFPSLKNLSLFRCNVKLMELMLKLTISSSMVSCELVELEMKDIKDFQVLHEDLLRHCTSLKTLWISACNKLRSVSQALKHLTSLTHLQIWSCDELDVSDIDGHGLKNLTFLEISSIPKLWALPEGLQHASKLRSLRIEGCKNLKCLPSWMSNLTSLSGLEHLYILKCEEIDISNLINHNLRDLHIEYIPKLVELPDGLQHASKLQTLWIKGCKNLKCLPSWMSNLTSLSSLEFLYISKCEEIDISNLINHNLRELHIKDIPKLVELSDGLQHASKLQTLTIKGCKNLKCLPSWMSNLTSLFMLQIRDCSSELHERCKNNTATDWPFISHIPNININGRWIKKAGIYR